ncbi:3',5'-cyclic AMP phosphodiesterase CpdA [Saccharopolyspora shandongensis]|uniref:3',5'-cyclic AMP phosphodiesterase CpdA n=1 Tax=Saccharopolyspora shandongensis TaxID=418495 RepID=A0A1H3HXD4_9PSEU|nr:metallophosphoesterase family protein [Saccharopolyspora shandongensis]SDY20042.1 3',5'-cyclic AMP phosphodiesterase CpdA [Saccharopolyspora shandongensis]
MSEQSDLSATPESTEAGVGRRQFMALGGLGAATVALGATTPAASAAPAPAAQTANLRFRADGTYKIVQFNDTQDDERIDRRTLELMNAVLDDQRPDLVILNGDNITGGCDTELEMRQAMNNIVQPMEERKIPWAVTYGNHDEDSTAKGGLDESEMLEFYRSYAYNVNELGPRGVTGTGNMNLFVHGSRGNDPEFNLWLLDSGRYAPGNIAGQDFAGYPTWDWLRMDQVAWYFQRSVEIERQVGRKVPGLMFIHIPLWEYRFMWFGSVDGRTDADHARGVARHGIVGERNEAECPGPFNSGMFNAILTRGDVKGVFCGHDHVNTYHGDYYGVLLGYAGNTGFGTYGLSGAERNRLRGARVYTLNENTENVLDSTYMVFAKDYGIDLTANDQSIAPMPLPS